MHNRTSLSARAFSASVSAGTKAETPEALSTLAGVRGAAKEPQHVHQEDHEAAGAASKLRGVFHADPGLLCDFAPFGSHKIQIGQLGFLGPILGSAVWCSLPFSRGIESEQARWLSGRSGSSAQGFSAPLSATGYERARPSSSGLNNRLRFSLFGAAWPSLPRVLRRVSLQRACRAVNRFSRSDAATERSNAPRGLLRPSDVGRAIPRPGPAGQGWGAAS
jgi:hypothetical protein